MRAARSEFVPILLFSIVVNLLALTPALFMLLIYDRVLASSSGATLVALIAIAAFCFLVLGLLDYARTILMHRASRRFQATLDRIVFGASLDARANGMPESRDLTMSSLDGVRAFLASPVALAVFDLPFVPLFLLALGAFHPYMLLLALIGGGLSIALALVGGPLTRGPMHRLRDTQSAHRAFSNQIATEAGTVSALGIRANALDRWEALRDEEMEPDAQHADRSAAVSVAQRTYRQFLQSAMLALGAALVLAGELTPGVMIAGSILLTRVLAPVDRLAGGWTVLQRALSSRRYLREVLPQRPTPRDRTDLPRPEGTLVLAGLVAGPAGHRKPVLAGISVNLPAGRALGVIGPSGAGKSSLGKALVGAWPLFDGSVTLGGIPLDQFARERRAELIGYLPQRAHVFTGTVAENIARLAPAPNSEAVLRAAEQAGAHEMILGLPDGYDTMLSADGAPLSGGQVQRLCLARALYSDPVLLVLDEPNSALDETGVSALNSAIRNAKDSGRSVVVMAHQPPALAETDMVAVLDRGRQSDLGPTRLMLRKYAGAKTGEAKDTPRETEVVQ